MKISGKLENTLIDLQKILHNQNQSIVNARAPEKSGQKCLSSAGSNRCQDTVAKPHKMRFCQRKNENDPHSVSKLHFLSKNYKFLKSLKNGQFLPFVSELTIYKE